jgi:hypothetical protein
MNPNSLAAATGRGRVVAGINVATVALGQIGRTPLLPAPCPDLDDGVVEDGDEDHLEDLAPLHRVAD